MSSAEQFTVIWRSILSTREYRIRFLTLSSLALQEMLSHSSSDVLFRIFGHYSLQTLKPRTKKMSRIKGKYRLIMLSSTSWRALAVWKHFSHSQQLCQAFQLSPSCCHLSSCSPSGCPRKISESLLWHFLSHELQNELQQRSRHDYKCHTSEHG